MPHWYWRRSVSVKATARVRFSGHALVFGARYQLDLHRGMLNTEPHPRVEIWLLVLVERFTLAVLRRGRCKRRMLARVNRALERLHLETCRKRWTDLIGGWIAKGSR
jgi:hypothetical protein